MDISDDDVVSPQLYADEERLHAMLAQIRRTNPVRWTAPKDYRPFWAITKYADILEVERDSDVFRAGRRNLLLPIEEEKRIWGRDRWRTAHALASHHG